MADVFLEIVIDAAEAAAVGIASRDEVEDPLEDALMATDLGAVTGGGGGSGVYVVDLEVREERFEEALAAIRSVLRGLRVPASTLVKRNTPTRTTFPVYDGEEE